MFLSKSFLFVTLGFLGFVACESTETNVSSQEATTAKYFDLAGFFDRQVIALKKENRGVEKALELNGKQDTVILEKPDWKTELAMVLPIDLNQPKFRDWFEKTTSKDKAGYVTVLYEQKQPVKTGPLRVEINFYDSQKKNVRFIKVDKLSLNYIYHKFERMIFRFEKGNQLYDYKIEGGEKVKLMDSTQFAIAAKIINPKL